MKFSIAGLILAATLTVPFVSFGKDGRKSKTNYETVANTRFETGMYRIANSNRVRLLVDKNADDVLRVALKDEAGVVYYSEKLSDKKSDGDRQIYSLIFDMDQLRDGDYYFEIFHKNGRVVKTFSIESKSNRTVSLQ